MKTTRTTRCSCSAISSTTTAQNGVTYVVSGAGAKLRPVGRRDFTAVSASTLHYLDLVFDDRQISGRAIDHSGDEIDAFTISR